MKNTVPMMVDGEVYDLPESEVEGFTQAAQGKAQKAFNYRVDGEDYSIPESEVQNFIQASEGRAEPIRRLSFADGSSRSFTGKELRDFMGGEYRTSDRYKADRDENEAIAKSRMPNIEDPVDVHEGEGFLENPSVKGVKYMAQKNIGPWIKAFITSPMRFADSAMSNGGVPIGVAGTPMLKYEDGVGHPLKDMASKVDTFVSPTKEEQSFAEDNGLSVPGKVSEVAQTIGAFATMLKTLGPVAGNTVMSAEAGNDTYLSIYDNAIANGADPNQAHKYAMYGGAIATLGTAAMGTLPISRILRIGTPVIDGTAEGAIKSYNDIVRQAMVGNIKRYIQNAVIAGGESAAIMFGDTYGTILMDMKANGRDISTWDAKSEALFEAAKAGGEGALVSAIFGGLHLADYKRSVRMGVEAQAKQAAYSPEGREMWRRMFPDGSKNVIRKRANGQDISRMDMMKAGFPEMSQKERNFVGDLMVEDVRDIAAQNIEALKAAKAAKEAAQQPPKVSPAPYAEEGAKPQGEPKPAEVKPIEQKPTAETLKPDIPDARAKTVDTKPTGATDLVADAVSSIRGKLEKMPKTYGVLESLSDPDGDGVVTARIKMRDGSVVDESYRIDASTGSWKMSERKKVTDAKDGANHEGNKPKSIFSHYQDEQSEADRLAYGYLSARNDLNEPGIPPAARLELKETYEKAKAEYEQFIAGTSTEDLIETWNDATYAFTHKQIRNRGTLAILGENEAAKLGVISTELTNRGYKYSNEGWEIGRRTKARNTKDAEKPPQTITDQGEEAVSTEDSVEKPTEIDSTTGSDDIRAALGSMKPEDIDRIFNEALGQGETAEVGGESAPVPAQKSVKRGKMVNKGKGPVPVEEKPTDVVGATPQGKKLTRAQKEAKALVESSGGALNEDEAAILQSLFGAAGDAAKRADTMEMALKADDAFDGKVYTTVKPIFEKALARMTESHKGVADFIRFVATNMGPGARQYLQRFALEQQRGANDGSEGTTGNRDGVVGGPDAAAGRGDSAPGGSLGGDESGRPAQGGAGAGAVGGVRTGAEDGKGGGGRDGVRTDGKVERHETSDGGSGTSSGPDGKRLASEDAGTGDNAGKSSLVYAANGNIDTRKSSPVRLTKGQRIRINEQARELAERPVGSLTDAEKDILRQFTGAGGLGFAGKDVETQIAALNQHFTDYSVVDAMWDALERAKVPLNDVVEPSAGSGNFPGRRPEKKWTLCELNPTTAKILRHLFPGAKVMEGTFEDMKLPPQDAFISNVPFLETRNHHNRPDVKTLHDFFFVHTVDQLKPNGVMAYITSSGTMNKKDSSVRRELVGKCDVIGAFRLPQDMFKENAGTSVTTDVIFLQRRPDGVAARPENAAINEAFVETVSHMSSDGVHEMVINKFYEEHPECLLGDLHEAKNKMYGGSPKLELFRSDATDLSQISVDYRPYPVAKEESGAGGASGGSASMEESKYPHTIEGLEKAGVKYALNTDGTFSQNIRMFDGVPHVKVDEFTLDGYEEGAHKAKAFEPVGGEIANKIASLQHIVDDASAFQNGDAEAQKRGLAEIEDYRKRFGKAPHDDRALKSFFNKNDEKTYFAELTSSFDRDFNPADVWREKTRYEGSGQKQADENASLIDQALASENGRGEINFASTRCKVKESDVSDLLESGYSISDVNSDGKPILQNNVIFESGNIYTKIDEMQAIKDRKPDLAAVIDRQIERLKAILPTPKQFDEINFVGNESWRVNNGEGEHEGWVMPVLRDAGISIHREANENGMFEYDVHTNGLLTPEEESLVGKRLSGNKLINKDNGESDGSYMQRSREAEASMADIYAKIRNRVAEDPQRVKRIEDGYNRENNGYVKPDYNKAKYLIKDTLDTLAKSGVTLRANQIQWVTQALIEGVGINAHDVGGGKTMAALALAHALKSRGAIHKPLFVVPSKTINTSWLNSYNGAQVIFPEAKIVNLGNLPANKRAKMLFDLANTNADFVFISHEGFEAIRMDPKDEIAAIRRFEDGLIDDTGDRNEAKKRDAMEICVNQIRREERDSRLTFDKLGIDCIIADEAHAFKNVGVSSQLERQHLGKGFAVKRNEKNGRATIESHRSLDFRFKSDWIAARNNGRNIFLLTATPTPNKPLELYTMLRSMGSRLLGEYGIETDRDFAARFFETGVRQTYSTDGGQSTKEILVELKNVYDLKAIMARYIDRIPMEYFSAQYGIKLPKEKVETLYVDMSTDMEMVQHEIQERVLSAASGGFGRTRKGEDTVVAAFMNGRDAAVTPYLYGGPHSRYRAVGRTHDPHTDKIELAVQMATREVQLGKDSGKPRTVIIFTDPQGGKDGKEFLPSDIKQSLMERGFKSTEVAIVSGSIITNPKTGNDIKNPTGERGQELKGRIQELFAPKEEKKGVPPPDPQIKVIIGSTSTIGEGLNLNTWTTLGINLDMPLTPGAMIQRKGRYVRFGNQHDEVRTVNLMTRGSFDTLSYGIMANKVGWNQAIWNAKVKDRISVEEEMADGSGVDPRRVIIESLRDPVEKIQRTVEYDLEDRTRAVGQARDQLAGIDSRIATQKRAISEAQAKSDNHRTSIVKIKNESAALKASIPGLEAKVERALSDLNEEATKTNEGAKVEAITKALEGVRSAVEARTVAEKRAEELARKPYEIMQNTPYEQQAALKKDPKSDWSRATDAHKKAVLAIEDAKKAVGKAKDAAEDAIKELSGDDAKAFARIYRNAFNEVLKTEANSESILTSIPYHEGVVKTAARERETAEKRIQEINAKRTDAETALRDAVEARDKLGQEWYDDFGGKNQRFKIEQATMKADMEAGNKSEDGWEDWLDEKQTLTEDMPAPASTGARPLTGGKLPDAEDFRPNGTERPDRPMTKSEVFKEAQRLFPELHFSNKGTHHKRGALGWLEVENRVIRTVDPRAISVLCHEIGHGVARLAENKVKMPGKAKTEFLSLGVDLYGSKRPNGGYASEGFAEFVRGFLCDYDLAKDFPNAHKWFFEDFGDRNPEFVTRLFALKGSVLKFANMAPAHEIRAMWDHKLPSSPSEIPFIRRALDYITSGDWKTDWVDGNYPIMRAMRNCKADYNFHDASKTPAEREWLILNHPYMLSTFFQGSALRFAEVDATANTVNLYGQPTGISLLEALSPVVSAGRDSVKSFLDFAVAMRGADYERKGIEFGVSRSGIAAAISENRNPKNLAVLKEITDWNHRVLHLLVDGGVIDEKQYEDICKENPVYIPMMRIFAENEINRARQLKGGKAVFNRKGGSQEVEHPIVAMIEQASRIRQAAQQGKVILSLVEMYDKEKAAGNKNLNRFMIEMPNPVKRETLWAEKIKEQIANIARAKFGTDDATIRNAMRDTWTEELFAYSQSKYNGKGNIVTVNVPTRDPKTGETRMKLRTFEVMDEGILKVLAGYSNPERVTGWDRFTQWLANGIRMGATVLKGSFSLVANPIRDTATGFHMNEYGHFVPVVSSIDGMVNSILNTDLYKTYFNMAGDMGSFYNGGSHMAAKEIAGQVMTPNAAMRQLKKGLFNMIGGLFSIPEIGPRLVACRNASNYWQAQGVGRQAADFVGRLCGGDVTIDFGRAGTKARKANRVILFMNAGIRELDQLARASGFARQLPWQNPGDTSGTKPEDFENQARKNHAKRFWSRGAALTAFALAAYLLNNDNEKRMRRWRELKPEYKWNNTMLYAGDSVDGEGTAIRIPTPFLDGLLFQALPIAAIESVRNGEASPLSEVADQMAAQLPVQWKNLHQLLRNFSPLAPEIDLKSNEGWNDRPIIPKKMENMAPEAQFTDNTTEFAKLIGRTLGISPAKFEYWYDQHTGGLINGTIRDIEALGVKRGAVGVNGDYSRLPIVGRIFLAPFSSSRVPGDFYDEMSELTGGYNGAANAKFTPEQLGRLRAMESVYDKTLAEYSKARRAVLANHNLSAAEGKRIADAYSKATIDVIRAFNDNSRNVDFRSSGIMSAVSAVSNPGSADSSVAQNLAILKAGDVTFDEAKAALDRYARTHDWSADTRKKRSRFLFNRWQ